MNLRQMLSSRHSKSGKTFFIAIDGRAGSGKSTLAQWLAKELDAQVVMTDDFASWNNPFNWWLAVIEQVFHPIRNGSQSISYPRTKWWDNHHPEPVINQPVTGIMILEGVGSSRKEFQEYISLNIFVDTARDICLRRGLERDRGTGKTAKELTRLWEGWFEEEEKYLQRDQPREHADIEIDGTKPLEDQITLS